VLTVADASGFAIGNAVIVATGGEIGAGVRGTKGVGGTWPAQSYADLSAMTADDGQPADTFAWLEDTGDVRQYVSGVWTAAFVDLTWYTEKAVPKALLATITGKTGNQLTLSVEAQETATGADVYFDNSPAFEAALAALPAINYAELRFPAGDFAISRLMELDHKVGWGVSGSGVDLTTVRVPDGVFHYTVFNASNSGGNILTDIHLVGNARNQGFGLSLVVTETDLPQGATYPSGAVMSLSSGCEFRNVRVTDVFQRAIAVSSGVDNWAYDCEVVLTDPLRSYVQWMYQWADTINGGCVDCSIDSAYLTSGWESFKSTGVQFVRPTGRNASFSMNASNSWLIEDFDVVIEADSQFDDGFSPSKPIIDINVNISGQDVSLGGRIVNATMLQTDYVNAENDTLRGIVVGAGNPNITISGGIYTAPDYAAPSALFGAWGIETRSPGGHTENFTVVGAAKPTFPNIQVVGGTISGCVADVID
jgi:hypothetical protein